MKKIFTALFLLLCVLSVNAQNGKKEQMTAAQIAEIQTKQMEMHLDLTREQRKKIYAVNLQKVKQRREEAALRRTLKENNKNLTEKERQAVINERLKAEKKHKEETKNILSKSQQKKFSEINSKRHKKNKKRQTAIKK